MTAPKGKDKGLDGGEMPPSKQNSNSDTSGVTERAVASAAAESSAGDGANPAGAGSGSGINQGEVLASLEREQAAAERITATTPVLFNLMVFSLAMVLVPTIVFNSIHYGYLDGAWPRLHA
jgi:hypothetical protein